MTNINKKIYLASIFTLIGVVLCAETGFSLPEHTLRPNLISNNSKGVERLDTTVNQLSDKARVIRVLENYSLPALKKIPPVPKGWTLLRHRANLLKVPWDRDNANPFKKRKFKPAGRLLVLEASDSLDFSPNTPYREDLDDEQRKLRDKYFTLYILFPKEKSKEKYPTLRRMIKQVYGYDAFSVWPRFYNTTFVTIAYIVDKQKFQNFYCVPERVIPELLEAWKISELSLAEKDAVTSETVPLPVQCDALNSAI